MRGKLIVIEGTDGSGKKTQTNLLTESLNKSGLRTEQFSFPNYSSPTGRIVGGPFLGKKYIGEGWFPETAASVDPKISCLYYAADRKYNIGKINLLLEHGIHVILDRYVYSNMAHHGAKIKEKEERISFYHWIEKLEFEMLELPRPDICLFLHVPISITNKLMENDDRDDKDQLEIDIENQKNASRAYEEIADIYQWNTIECTDGEIMRGIFEIHDEIIEIVKNKIEI